MTARLLAWPKPRLRHRTTRASGNSSRISSAVPSVDSLSATTTSRSRSPARAKTVLRHGPSQCPSFVETTTTARSRMRQGNASRQAQFAKQERVVPARCSGVMCRGRVVHRGAVAHLHHVCRHAHGDCAGGQVTHDHASGCQHASVSDRHTGKDDRSRTEPDGRADHDVLLDPRLAHEGRSRLVAVVRRGDVHARAEERVLAHDDPALAVTRPQRAVLSDVRASTDLDALAVAERDGRSQRDSVSDPCLPPRRHVRVVPVMDEAEDMKVRPRIEHRSNESQGSLQHGCGFVVAVVVPFLNEREHLPTFLASIDRQTRRPDELVLVDDGSTDGSFEIAKAFSVEHPYATAVRRPPRSAETDRLATAAELRAFQWGLEQVKVPYDIVAKLDA